MEDGNSSLRLVPDQKDGRNRHICAFFNGMEEHYRVLQPFITSGFDQGDRAFHLVDPERRDDHLERLADAGIDVQGAIASGQLEVHPWQDGPLHGDQFDQDTWLAGFEEVLQSGHALGSGKTRFLAQMEWALVDMPGIDDMVEFESRVNHVVPKYDDAVICSYDLLRFGASTVMYALRTHPAVIIGGLLHENPFYVDPDAFLLEMRGRGSASADTTTAK
jgi:MEDS: MEthanogen/methylotroph, DcmR Sensory domain